MNTQQSPDCPVCGGSTEESEHRALQCWCMPENTACARTDQPDNPLATQVAGGHYKDLRIQPIEYIHANGLPFAEGSVVKYVTRWRAKGGIDDLKKAKHFIELLIELETRGVER